jgi:hypothetical protein
MAKKLNIESVQNDLAGLAFFQPSPMTPTLSSPSGKNRAPKPAKAHRKSASLLKQARPVPEPNKAKEQWQTGEEQTEKEVTVRPTVRKYARTPVRRTITRYAFEFFQDQIETLKRLSLEQKMEGEKGSMSEMVREAIDGYIARKLNNNDEGPDER